MVIRNGLIGDTIFVIPVFDRLHATFPNARLDVATSERSIPLLGNNQSLSNVFPIPTRFSVWAHMRFFLSLRRFRYDIVVVQESNSHYTLMAKLVGARFVVGFDNKLSRFLSYSVAWPSGVHAVIAELETVRGWTDSNRPVVINLPVADEDIEQAREILVSNGAQRLDKVVCIHPGCSGKESKREWLPEYYAAVADRLIENHGAEIVLDGISQDKAIIDKIISCMRHTCVSVLGKTNLRQFLGLMKLSKLLLGPDTGTLHLATAVGTPVVMLIGPTDPVDTGPFDPLGVSKVLRSELPCIGCSLRNPKPTQWEICKDLYPVVCMKKLVPELVYAEILNALGWRPDQVLPRGHTGPDHES